jgi:hypothetical protein
MAQPSRIDFGLMIRIRSDLPILPITRVGRHETVLTSITDRIIFCEFGVKFDQHSNLPMVGDKFAVGAC